MKCAGLLFVPLMLAGCAEKDPTHEKIPVDIPDPFAELAAGIPPFTMDVTAAVDWWEAFVSPGKRDAYLPDTPVTFNQASRDVIAATLRAAGAEVGIRDYPAGVFIGAPDAVPVRAYAVEATWPGTDATAGAGDLGRMGLIAHYDTQLGTIEGAYDNGSGTAAVVHTCIALSQVEMRRTLTCILFDAEEVGVVASSQYVDDIADEQPFDLVLGFDMVGISCPIDISKQYQWVGANVADLLHGFVQRVGREVAGHDPDCLEVFDFNDRNSDESTFASAGIPTVRFAGIRTAGGYPEYHTPNDTPEFIYDYVGGRANWEAGFGATMRSAYLLALMFDGTSLDEAGLL